MKNGDKIKYLEGYRWALENIKMLTARIEKLNYRLYNLRSQIITDMPRGGQGIDNIDLIAHKQDIENEVLQRIKQAEETKQKIFEVISSVNDPKFRMILEMRYIDCMTLCDIGDTLGYSYNHICRLHTTALDDIKIGA